MPELPEVEVTRRGIAEHVVGRTIVCATVREPRLRWPVAPQFAQVLSGACIAQVCRRGKFLILDTDQGAVIWHLGMSGTLRILPHTVAPQRHDHVDLTLDNGQMVRFRDPRRFGSVHVSQDSWAAHPMVRDLGPEPLGPEFSGDYLFTRSRARRAPVKALLMDGQVVAGIGNIYASESLFRAGIHPGRPARRISQRRYQGLAQAVRQVLGLAIEQGGTTLRDFLSEAGRPGYFRQSLQVYGRDGEPCVRCGEPLRMRRIAQRSSYYCIPCQR